MATRLAWDRGRPPLAKRFEVRLLDRTGDAYHGEWRALALEGDLGWGDVAGTGVLALDAPPGCADLTVVVPGAGPAHDKLPLERGSEAFLPTRLREPRGEALQRSIARRYRLGGCEALLTGISAPARPDERALVALGVDGTVLARSPVERPRLPHPALWPVLPLAVLVDGLTLPFQALLLWIFTHPLPTG